MVLGNINASTVAHTKQVVEHSVRFQQSYKCLESTSELVNSTPNASIRIPTSTYKIKKVIQSGYKTEFHIQCAKCQNYSVTTSTKSQIACEFCSNNIKASDSNYFVYIPIKQQLLKSINENFEQIQSSQANNTESTVISDVHDSIQHKRIQGKYKNAMVLSLAAFTDGIVMHKSSSRSVWVIQIAQNFLHPKIRYIPKNILVVGLHHGLKKPEMKDFFSPLLKELKSIQRDGGFFVTKNVEKILVVPIILQCCCDLPAKAEVQCMVNFNGRMACGYCLHPGEAIKSKTSNSYVRYIRTEQPSQIRKHEHMLDIYKNLKSKNSFGVKSISCMVGAKHFDLINGFGIDYMHSTLLGVQRNLLSLWLDSTNHKEQFYINPKNQAILDQRITNICPTCDISRKPKKIADRAKYKANEYRSLLLYYLTYSLNGLLPKRYIEHFKLLSSSIYMLLEERISSDNIDCAELRLQKFADEFEELYGKHHVTMNLHLQRHLANAVRQLGPLWAQSAFGFESNNGVIVNTPGRNNILHSLAWKYSIRSNLPVANEKNCAELTVDGKAKIEITPIELSVLSAFGLAMESQLLSVYKSVFIRSVKYTSLKYRSIGTIDYFVSIKGSSLGAIKYFFVFRRTVYAMINIFKIKNTSDHLIEVENTQFARLFI